MDDIHVPVPVAEAPTQIPQPPVGVPADEPPTMVWVADPIDPDGGHYRHLTWREHAEQLDAEVRRLRPIAALVSHLDRCIHGRHKGDVCGECGGPSLGNPVARGFGSEDYVDDQLVIGYDMSGRPIVIDDSAPLAATLRVVDRS